MKAPAVFGLSLDLTSKSDYYLFIDEYFLRQYSPDARDPYEKVYGAIDVSPYYMTLYDYVRRENVAANGYRYILRERYWSDFQANRAPDGTDIVSLGANLGAIPAVQVNGYVQAAKAVREFLEANVPLPFGWEYDVRYFEIHTVNTNLLLPTGAYATVDAYTIEAKAKKNGRTDIPAGVVTRDPTEDWKTRTDTWRILAESFPSVAKPVYLETKALCKLEDAASDPALIEGGNSGTVPIGRTAKTDSVPVSNIDQGFASDGQAPWDSQPDVLSVDPSLIPGVTGTIVGAGYVPTLGQYPPGFLDWLNLRVPNATTVQMILGDDSLLDPYLARFSGYQTARAGSTTIGAAGTTNPGIKALPNPYSFAKLEPLVTVETPIDLGSGLPEIPLPVQFDQIPPRSMPTESVEPNDYVQMMLELNATEFLNMLAMQYRETLLKVASIPAARKQLDANLALGDVAEVESFLRNFSASSYATPPTTQNPTPSPVVEAQVLPAPGFDTTTILIALGVLLGIYLVTRKAA